MNSRAEISTHGNATKFQKKQKKRNKKKITHRFFLIKKKLLISNKDSNQKQVEGTLR